MGLADLRHCQQYLQRVEAVARSSDLELGASLVLGTWCLELGISLVFGAWSLELGFP